MKLQILETLADFESLKEGDLVACRWYRDVKAGGINHGRQTSHNIALVKPKNREIILDGKYNVYFNYELHLLGESNLAKVAKITF